MGFKCQNFHLKLWVLKRLRIKKNKDVVLKRLLLFLILALPLFAYNPEKCDEHSERAYEIGQLIVQANDASSFSEQYIYISEYELQHKISLHECKNSNNKEIEGLVEALIGFHKVLKEKGFLEKHALL